MVNVKYNTFAAAVLWDTNKWRYPYPPGEMLQRYIRALADPSVIVLIIPREWHPLGAVARMGSAPSFLVIALRIANRHFWCRCWELTIPSDCAKKCQQLSRTLSSSSEVSFIPTVDYLLVEVLPVLSHLASILD